MTNLEKFEEMLGEGNITPDEVANLFLNYHGTQLLTDDFIEFLADEGYIEEEEE